MKTATRKEKRGASRLSSSGLIFKLFGFRSFCGLDFLEEKTSAPEVFCGCLFILRAHLKTSLVMVSYYGYEI